MLCSIVLIAKNITRPNVDVQSSKVDTKYIRCQFAYSFELYKAKLESDTIPPSVFIFCSFFLFMIFNFLLNILFNLDT